MLGFSAIIILIMCLAGCDNKVPRMLVGALNALRSNGAGLEILKTSQPTITEMFDDLITTYTHRMGPLKGIEHTALKYQRVYSEATSVVAAVDGSASQMVKWLPTFKRLVTKGKQAPALAVLGKLLIELRPVSRQFQEYSKARSDVRDEVEAHVVKAAELENSSEWKKNIFSTRTRCLPRGGIMECGEKYPCEVVYPTRKPDYETPDAFGECELAFVLNIADLAPLGYVDIGMVAPIAFMVGDLAGASISFHDDHKALQRDFHRLRKDLTEVHEKLVEQVNAFKDIQRRLEQASKSTGFLAEVATDPAVAELLDEAIDQTIERFIDVRHTCKEYILDATVPAERPPEDRSGGRSTVAI